MHRADISFVQTLPNYWCWCDSVPLSCCEHGILYKYHGTQGFFLWFMIHHFLKVSNYEKNPSVHLHPSGVGHTCTDIVDTPGRAGGCRGVLCTGVHGVSRQARGEASHESGIWVDSRDYWERYPQKWKNLMFFVLLFFHFRDFWLNWLQAKANWKTLKT